MAGLRGEFTWESAIGTPVELVVTPGAGDVVVVGDSPGTVRVKGTYHIRAFPASRAERLAAEIQRDPPVEVRGREVRVGDLGKYAERLGPGILEWVFEGISIDYEISVPPETEVRIEGGSGDISLSRVSGPVSVRTGSGDVEAEEIERDVEINVGSGDVLARGIGGELRVVSGSGDVVCAEVRRDVEVRTGSGEVRGRGIRGDLSVVSGSGDVALEDVAGDIAVRTGSGDIRIDSGIGEGASWELRTGSGDIEVLLPRGSRVDIAAETRFGEFESDFPPDVGARCRIEAKTGSGDIKIRAR